MQMALGIAVAALSNPPDEECWFCKEQGKHEKVTDVEADPDHSDSETEETVAENDEKNDASKLGSNLGSKPSWNIVCPAESVNTTVLSAAHHCIPGNASMKKAKTLLKYMKKGQSPVNLAGDIGYGINHENNGVWLPGNYNVRKNKEHYDKNWGGHSQSFKNDYAVDAMNASRRQFHDAHSQYSKNVRKTLDTMAEKLGKPKDTCPICGEEHEKTRPPYGLVGRIDFISKEHKKLITKMQKRKLNKYVNSGYFTSSRVKELLKRP